jgi:UDP-glucose 4-epimerase
MTTILITGNAGMIGSVLSNYFIEQNYRVVGVDNLSGGYIRNINKKVIFYQADILDYKKIDTIFNTEKPDYVIHCAAYAAEILSPFIRRFNYNNNLIGSINIINACINHSVQKIVNFSSFATYGEGKPPFDETQTRNPKDPYGIAKLAVEMDLQEAYEHFGLRYSTVLPHNVVSKYQNYYDRYRNVIAIWIRQILHNENISIFGDGQQVRSFSDATFLCQPVEKLLYNHDSEFFNIGSDQPIKIIDAANKTINIMRNYGYSSSDIEFLEPRKEIKIAFCNHDKAIQKLCFDDQTDLDKIITEMVEYAITLPKENVEYMNYEINKNIYSYWRK